MANEIVEKSRKEAEKIRFLEKNRILEVAQTKESKDMYCNCCGIKEEDNKELKVGHHNRSTALILCKECLSKLGDIIWEVS